MEAHPRLIDPGDGRKGTDVLKESQLLENSMTLLICESTFENVLNFQVTDITLHKIEYYQGLKFNNFSKINAMVNWKLLLEMYSLLNKVFF